MIRLGLALACGVAATTASADCAPAPEPVLSLSYGSRYTDDSATRSEVDAAGSAEADDALRPVDDFLRDLTETANTIFDEGADKAAIADCVVGQIAVWAAAEALSDLQSQTSNLTVGSRLAGFGLVLLQVLPHASDQGQVDQIKIWLRGLVQAQTRFWELDAPNGARQGNLRAWAALGGASVASILDDPALRSWAAWSVSNVLCSANADGSLPQEMGRGSFALHYQLHAIAPLVVATLLLDRQGVDLQQTCDAALARIVAFAVDDLDSGAATQAITGEVQSYFDGTDTLDGFNLAFIEPYLQLDQMPDREALDRLADPFRPLSYSKLGGNQTLIWQAMR
jgi:poly(beta-D-mannuronate) lyase